MASTSKATTLFNLKDEYLKAKLDTKLSSQTSSNHKKLKDIIHYKKAEKEKRLAEKDAKLKKRAARLALTEQEEQNLAKSRSILEAKTAVYDKLLHQEGDSSENILVDFSQKRSEGHTKSQIAFDYDSKPAHSDETASILDEPSFESDEVHLSNVDKGEIRTKGVGYYSFSKDPEIRKQQMDFLNSMRESTERSRELFLSAKKKRKQDKLERINRLRKRLDMSPLTVLPNDKPDDEAELENDVTQTDSRISEITSDNKQSQAHSSTKPLPSPDIGKSIEEKFLIREQTMWERKVEELRNEREMEFAPVYDTYNSRSQVNIGEEELDDEDDAIVNFISFVRRNT